MAVDFFLKLKDVKGESKDDAHKDEIDVLAWSWGMSQSGTVHLGGGAGSGKANVQDISITKYVDIASPTLAKFCAQGKHIAEGKMVVRKAGTNPLEYMVYDLETIMVTSISTGGSGGQDRITENVTLNFAKVKFKYQSQGDDGAADMDDSFKFDIPASTWE